MKRLVLLVALVGCRVSPPTATSVDAERGHVDLAELVDGRALVIRKCGNCHTPPLPKDHTLAEWPRKLDEMAQRASLDSAQRHLIQQYFVVMAQR